MNGFHFINNTWVEGTGESFISTNPATLESLWTGHAATPEEIDTAVQSARLAFMQWSDLSFKDRVTYLNRFNDLIKKNQSNLALIISEETGKPLWEAKGEIESMLKKLPIAIEAYQDRCKERIHTASKGTSITRHKPHGVVAVLGPFNLPAHLPNGHIIPALLAGNTVVLKPSELTPKVAQTIFESWEKAQLPAGVINLVQGKGESGQHLAGHPDLSGLMFTGSYRTGKRLTEQFSKFPEKIIALEMGGNNPLIVHQIKNIKAAVYSTILSAYITAGQRCTCARRLIVTRNPEGEQFVQALIAVIQQILLGPFTQKPEPFAGPLISNAAANQIIDAYQSLISKGASILVPMKRIQDQLPFLSPGLIDVTNMKERIDEEIFGPLLQLIWVDSIDQAIQEANHTSYGLSAGILCEDKAIYHTFLNNIKAGVVNWNRPLTGSDSNAPFGGIGKSGNHRPSGYYAADYCAYPMACLEEEKLELASSILPGIQL